MANATVSQLNFGGSGSSGSVTYSDADMQALLAQPDAVDFEPVSVIVGATIDGISPPQEVTGRIAVDRNGKPLDAASNLVSMPCPPYCNQ